MSHTQESLVRLAEIANVVSRHQSASALAQTMAAGSQLPGHVSAALRKRPGESVQHLVSNDGPTNAKKARIDDKDVRFREYQAEIWSEKFEDLCEFRKFYGHCHVPHTYERNAPLAQWVKRQRYQYKLKIEGKRSTLSDERVRLLNQIGFIWNSHDAVWEERWAELIAYKGMYGHCIVPSNYEKNPQLAVWVKRQRRQYKFYTEGKATSMTPERIAKLEKIGFAWDCRKCKSDSDDDDDEDNSTSSPVSETIPQQPVPSPVVEAKNPQQTCVGIKMPTNFHPRNDFFSFSQATLKKELSAKPAQTINNKVQTASAHPRCDFFSFGKFAPKKSAAPTQPKPPPHVQPVSHPRSEFISFSQKKFTKFPNIKLSKF